MSLFALSLLSCVFTFIKLFVPIAGIVLFIRLFRPKGDIKGFGISIMPFRTSVFTVRLVLPMALLGCSDRRIPVPALVPDRAGQEALAHYDRNKDGFLDPAELASCPALTSCLKQLDKDKDGRLSGAEIASRIADYQNSRVGLRAIAFQVTLDGQPLGGASVTLIPEKFLGDVLKPATGTTDARGRVYVATQGSEVPGVAFGVYRIEVSKKDAAGREIISACYNQATILGLEVAPDTNVGALCFALYSYLRH